MLSESLSLSFSLSPSSLSILCLTLQLSWECAEDTGEKLQAVSTHEVLMYTFQCTFEYVRFIRTLLSMHGYFTHIWVCAVTSHTFEYVRCFAHLSVRLLRTLEYTVTLHTFECTVTSHTFECTVTSHTFECTVTSHTFVCESTVIGILNLDTVLLLNLKPFDV